MPSPTWVQTQLDTSNTATSVLTTTTFTFLSAFTSGHGLGGLIYLFVIGGRGSATISAIQDNLGNNYLIRDIISLSANSIATSFGAPSVNGTPTSITVTVINFSPSATWTVYAVAEEMSGAVALESSSVFINASTTTPTSGSFIATANSFIIGIGTPSGGPGTLTAGSGFTLRTVDQTNLLFSETQSFAAGGSIAATFNYPTTQPGPVWGMSFASTCISGSLAKMGVGCSIGWRASLLAGAAWRVGKAIKKNGVITRRSLILPSRRHNGGPPLED